MLVQWMWCAVNVKTYRIPVCTRVRVCVWWWAATRPLGRKRSMIETIMPLSVFMLTSSLTDRFWELSLSLSFSLTRTHNTHTMRVHASTFTHTPAHIVTCSTAHLSHVPFHSILSLSGRWPLSVPHFPDAQFAGRLLCSGAVSPYVNLVANLSLHSSATRQSSMLIYWRRVQHCTEQPQLTPEDWELFVCSTDCGRIGIPAAHFALLSLKYQILIQSVGIKIKFSPICVLFCFLFGHGFCWQPPVIRHYESHSKSKRSLIGVWKWLQQKLNLLCELGRKGEGIKK